MTWARKEFGLRRIWASTDCRNERSQRVLQKLGFKREGVRLAQHPDRDGTSVEEAVFGLDLDT